MESSFHPTNTTTTRTTNTTFQQSGYVTRAHPPKEGGLPVFPIHRALSIVLESIQERKSHRAIRWERNRSQRIAQLGEETVQKEGPFRNQDETVELALNLNLDPKKPGQALRGSLSLPHGTGKTLQVIVFTNDTDLATRAVEAGAMKAGGHDLIQSIYEGTLPVTSFERALATPDMISSLSKIARILGPRGLMPNAKLNTIRPAEAMIDAVREQTAGTVQFRTEKNGIVQVPIGKGSFTTEQLLENIRVFMNGMQNVKPEAFGKGKKKSSSSSGSGGSSSGGAGKGTKYYLTAHITATQAKGSVAVDLRTMDPTSTYFMGSLPE